MKMNKKAVCAAAFSIALVTFLAYLPSLQNGFVNWDDLDYVYENALIRSIDLNFLKTILTTPLVYNWHPLTMLSYAVDYSLWGLDPLGYHLVNIVIHSMDTALVFALALRLEVIAGGERRDGPGAGVLASAFVAAALFGLHPLHVESVSWISERKDGLCALFFLSSALMYLRYAAAESGKGRYYAFSLLLFIPALMSKSMAVTLPAVLLILDFHPLRRRLTTKVLYERAPFFLLALLVSALTIWAQKEGGALAGINAYPAPWRAVIALRAYAFYIYKTLAPVNLAPFYPFPAKSGLLGLETFAALAVFSAASVFSLLTARRNRVFLAVWLYYLITLLPVSGLIQVGEQAAADRYAYLPSIGFFVLAGAGVKWLMDRRGKKIYAYGAPVAAAAVIAVLAFMTMRQQAAWRDSMALWTHEIRSVPQAPIGYYNRGVLYTDMRDFRRALPDYDMAAALDPEFKDTFVNRGIALLELGRYGEAVDDFSRYIALDPEYAPAYVNRGNARLKAGEIAAGIDDLNEAIRLDPQNPVPYYNLGFAHLRAGDAGMARRRFTEAYSLGFEAAGAQLRMLDARER